MKTLVVALSVTLLVLGLTAGASTTSLQERVDLALEQNPGSVQIGPNEIAIDGSTILVLEMAGSGQSRAQPAGTVGGCPAGKFCAYSKVGYAGDYLSYSTCESSHSVAGISVRSIANSRSSGSVLAYKGSTLLATVAAGTGKNVSKGTSKLSCS